MSTYHVNTIKDKLTAAIVAICTLVLACAGTIFIVRGQTIFLETTSNHLSTLAEMIATNSKASLAFEDAKGRRGNTQNPQERTFNRSWFYLHPTRPGFGCISSR